MTFWHQTAEHLLAFPIGKDDIGKPRKIISYLTRSFCGINIYNNEAIHLFEMSEQQSWEHYFKTKVHKSAVRTDIYNLGGSWQTLGD